MIISNILCNMSSSDSIGIAQAVATYLGVLGTAVILIVGFKQYKKQKKYDALVGFYCQLKRYLELFDKSFSTTNVLNYFCNQSELAESVKTYQRVQFDFFRNEIINFILRSPNQVPISTKLSDNLLSLVQELLYLDGISNEIDKRPKLFVIESEASEKANTLKNLIFGIKKEIDTELKRY